MPCCARMAPLLLTHVNLLLFLYAGAGLASAARLKWDPSTYAPLRELLPAEYAVLAAFACAAGFTLLALGHLCAAALMLRPSTARRVMLLMYALMMAVLVSCQVAWCIWMGFRMEEFMRSERAKHVAVLLSLKDHIEGILEVLSFLEIPEKIKMLMKEADEDLVRNVYVAGASAALLAVLQPLAIALALLCAFAPEAARPRHRRHQRHRSDSWATITTTASVERMDEREKAPLRTAYKNGRIVIL